MSAACNAGTVVRWQRPVMLVVLNRRENLLADFHLTSATFVS